LPPRKRFRDSISPNDSVEKDTEAGLLPDIEVDATAVEVAAVMDVEAGVDAGIGMKVDVEVDVEDEVEGEFESSDRGTIEVGVDVVDKIDIPDGMLMPDAVEHLEQVEEVVQNIYGHVMEIPFQRVEGIKTGHRDLEARSLFASRERASLLDHVASLERSNARLQGTLMMESARADRFQRRMGFIERELRQIRRQLKNLLTNEWRRRWLPIRQTYCELDVECQSKNIDVEEKQENVGGNETIWRGKLRRKIKNNGEELKRNRGAMGMEIPIGMIKVLCLSPNNDLAAYTQRFQKLTMMCTKMVPEEVDRVQFIEGLPDNIQGNLNGYAVKNAENKRRLDNNQRDNHRLKGRMLEVRMGQEPTRLVERISKKKTKNKAKTTKPDSEWKRL
ncbi:hypothetical protein Tco_0835876, partial [Tanacetum coccineum]